MNIDKINDYKDKTMGKEYLYKYIKSDFIDFWLHGNLRFGYSTNYSNIDISDFSRDDENCIIYNPDGVTITNDVGMKSNVKKIYEKVPPYFLASFSLTFDPKLFILFGYNTCIIIKNKDHFIYQTKVPFTHKEFIYNEKIEYIDEQKSIPSGTELEFKKRFVYHYENEFRFIIYNCETHQSKKEIIIKCFELDCEHLMVNE